MTEPRLSQVLADDLGLSQADIIAHIDHLFGRPHGLADTEIITIVRADLDPWCIRSYPDGFFGSSEPQNLNVCRCTALGGREHSPGPSCPPDRGRRGLTGAKEEQ